MPDLPNDDVESYNAGYHRGLNTEYHDVSVRKLYDEWLRGTSWETPSFASFREGFMEGVADYSDGADGLRWFCENCDHVNITTTTYFEERAVWAQRPPRCFSGLHR
jgi:hypothetical protein